MIDVNICPIHSCKLINSSVIISSRDSPKLKSAEEEFNPMDQMNKNMNMMFPVMYLAVALVAPLGLALYWLVSNLLMIIERLIINKVCKDEEE